jgi:hypothetical protein
MAFLNKTFLVNLIFIVIFYIIVSLEWVYDKITYKYIGRPLNISVQDWYPYLNLDSKINPLSSAGWWVHLLVFVILIISFDKLKPKIKFLN